MSIKGHPYRWFRSALERRDLLGVRASAAELGRVTLADALSIVLLIAERGDLNLDRASARWLGRLALENPAIGLAELRAALTALERLPHSLDDARTQLAALCAELGLNDIVGLSGPDERDASQVADRRS